MKADGQVTLMRCESSLLKDFSFERYSVLGFIPGFLTTLTCFTTRFADGCSPDTPLSNQNKQAWN